MAKLSETQQKQNRKQWIEALRSGKYKQGTNTLGQFFDGEVHYCCLGVLCELAQIKQEKFTGANFIQYKISKKDKGKKHVGLGYLPKKAMDYVGLKDYEGKFIALSKDLMCFLDNEVLISTSLSELNDNGHSFEEIASIIESEPEGLFLV